MCTIAMMAKRRPGNVTGWTFMGYASLCNSAVGGTAQISHGKCPPQQLSQAAGGGTANEFNGDEEIRAYMPPFLFREDTMRTWQVH